MVLKSFIFNCWGTQFLGISSWEMKHLKWNRVCPTNSASSEVPIKQLSRDTGILSSLPQPLSRSRLCWCEELTRPWSGPGVFHLGVCQELLCRDPSRIVDCYDSKTGDLEQIKGWGHAGVERFTLLRSSLWLERGPVLPFHETKAQSAKTVVPSHQSQCSKAQERLQEHQFQG